MFNKCDLTENINEKERGNILILFDLMSYLLSTTEKSWQLLTTKALAELRKLVTQIHVQFNLH